MRSQLKRLAIAACLSLVGMGTTILWYYETAPKIIGTGEAPLAQAARVDEEVLRRPPTRLLWRPVNIGDNLYNGETIRTSDQAEMRIQFPDGRYVDLQPDSLIVLQKSNGDINLDLLDGSLFVNGKAGGKAESGLLLNSANGKVDLTNASATLTRSAGDSLNLQVVDGQAKIKSKDGKVNTVESGKSSSINATGVQLNSAAIGIISPAPGKPYFVEPDGDTKVVFKWRNAPPAAKVTLLAGTTRKGLKEAGVTPTAGETQMAAKVPFGKVWFKLVAKDSSGATVQESPVEHVNVNGRYPPTFLTPRANDQVKIDESPSTLKVTWQKSEDAFKVQVQIGKTADLKAPVFDKEFSKEASVDVPGITEGEYYARISAYYFDSDHAVSSKTRHFSVRRTVKDPVKISWNIPPEKMKQPFGQKPQLDLSWQPKNRQNEIVSYQVKLVNEENPGDDPVTVESKDLKAKADVPAAGRYIASVEARDKDGEVIGSSEPLTLTAEQAPLLQAPVFDPPEGDLTSGLDGRTLLKWSRVEGAKEYLLTVTNKDGKELLNRKYPETEAKLKNLMPGEYQVKVESVDGFGRQGQPGQARKLLVPDKSNVKSPKLKKVLVE